MWDDLWQVSGARKVGLENLFAPFQSPNGFTAVISATEKESFSVMMVGGSWTSVASSMSK